MARELTGALRTELFRDRPSACAKQRALQISAPSECSSTAENGAKNTRATDAWRTNAAHEPHGATGSLSVTTDAGPRGIGAIV